MSIVVADAGDVYKQGDLAARITRTAAGIEFRYLEEWVRSDGPAVASTLPVTREPVVTHGGAVPAFFAGLLPEGRRLSALRRVVKTSLDDELGLLLAVGSDPVGDVQVVPRGRAPLRVEARVRADAGDFGGISFDDVLRDYGIDPDRVALAGVQDKVSLAMLSLPVRGTTAEFVLKLTPPEYPGIVQNEAFFLRSARLARMEAVRSQLVRDAQGREGLAVSRFDRVQTAQGVVALAVEDGCQVLGLHPEAKYRVSTERLISALSTLCAAPRVAAAVLYRQVLFAYVSGNGDAHAKNFSVVSGRSGYQPAPAYDLPCTALYGDTSLALSVAGKRDGNVSRARFLALADGVGIRDAAARRIIDEVAASVDRWIDDMDELPFDVGRLRQVKRVIRHRQRLLSA